MKRKFMIVLLSFMMLPPLYMAASVSEFSGGASKMEAVLAGPSYEATVNISMPAEAHARKAGLNLSTVHPISGPPDHPLNLSLSLEGRELWTFKGPSYGPFGRQDRFLNESMAPKELLGPGGGQANFSFRIPKKASVQHATVEGTITGKGTWLDKQNWTGMSSYIGMGSSVAMVGDVNRDGYDDIVVGEPNHQTSGSSTGIAYLYLGGPSINFTPDFELTLGSNINAYLGFSVAGAGDVNGDGYPDIIVGAPTISYYGSNSGCACIYYGGPKVNKIPDAWLYGMNSGDQFGYSVAGAGDLNGDGYDDVVVGAPLSDYKYSDSGRAFVFLGSQTLDNGADRELNESFGAYSGDKFGLSVAGAGDVNGDGYDDLLVGAPFFDGSGRDSGRVSLYLGNDALNLSSPLNMTGEASYDYFGYSVAGAGDVNGDGLVDWVVGAYFNQRNGEDAGSAYVYLGGNTLDSDFDVVLGGSAVYDMFGYSVSGAGDIDKDGYSDIIVGAPYADTRFYDVGTVCIFRGGAPMGSQPFVNISGDKDYEGFGYSVSGGGDVNGDGLSEMLVGAPGYDGASPNIGKVSLIVKQPGILAPELSLGASAMWKSAGYFNGSFKSTDFASALNGYLAAATPSGSDAYDNRYVDVVVTFKGKSTGELTLFNLSVTYDYTATVPEFSGKLNDYLFVHKVEKDLAGNLAIPLELTSQTAGKVLFKDLNINYDDAPAMVRPIPAQHLEEDTANPELLDLYEFFDDDIDQDVSLNFTLVSATNQSYLFLEIQNNHILSADAASGSANDNWTGTSEIVVAASDHWGSTRWSNPFTLFIDNVNDPPLVTSAPVTAGAAGVHYLYNVTAIDGDGDKLFFCLSRAPANMTIGRDNGSIRWTPAAGGNYGVSVTVEDGLASATQEFTISVPNRPPRFTSVPPTPAWAGLPYVYNVTGADDDNDPLTFSLVTQPEGMAIDPSTGRLVWTPPRVGDFDVSIKLWDGKAGAFQDFTLTVAQPNRAPRFISTAPASATAFAPYAYDAKATDEDGDQVTFSLINPASGMTIDAASGRFQWTPEAVSNVPVAIKASDGRGGETLQEFVIRVGESVRPKVAVTYPAMGQIVKGKIDIRGNVTLGTLPVQKVQIMMDGGIWMDATGGENWSYSIDTGTLKTGLHTLGARAYDGHGYSEVVEVSFDVERAGTGGGEPLPLALIAVVVVIIAAVAGIVAFLARRKKAPAEAPSVPSPGPPQPAASSVPPPTPASMVPAPPERPEPAVPPEPPKPKQPDREFTP